MKTHLSCGVTVPLSGKKMLKLLNKHGWCVVRIKGSHHIVRLGEVELSVPVHGNKSLGRGLEHKILKEAGIKK